jgi:hypothetical protein
MRGNDGVLAAVPATLLAFWGQRIALAARYLTAWA